MNLTDTRDIAADRQTVSAAMGSKFCFDIGELTIEQAGRGSAFLGSRLR